MDCSIARQEIIACNPERRLVFLGAKVPRSERTLRDVMLRLMSDEILPMSALSREPLSAESPSRSAGPFAR